MTEQYPKEDRPAELKKDQVDDPQLWACALVNAQHYNGALPIDDVYVVWYTYVLGNWKALVSTNVKDNRYYEVTKGETYVDAYAKVMNTCV
jgi:hypothetical protein